MHKELELVTENKQSLKEKKFFLIRVNGDSMENAGISNGDFLLVDRKIRHTLDSIIIAEINGKWTVKTLSENKDGLFLMPQNPKYQPIQVMETDSFKVIGKVIKVIKSFN
jgi:DNA polymerase V